MICELFMHLCPRDLIVCSMVNKRWHSLFSGFRLHKLAVMLNWRDGFRVKKWSYPERRIKDQEVCQTNVFLHLIDWPLLSNLKHLALYGEWSALDSNMLNNFLNGCSQLVQIEFSLFSYGARMHLKLPKLRVLVFDPLCASYAVSFDCPKLNVLFFRDCLVSRLEVKKPETIRKLETNLLDSTRLVQFQNVECLVTDNIKMICRSVLLVLTKLKELHFNERIREVVLNIGSTYQLKQKLKEFLADVQELKGVDFKFKFAGFRMNKQILDQIDLGDQNGWEYMPPSDEYVYMRNCHLIEPDGALSFIYKVDYSALMGNVTGGELPTCFFRKFTGIQSVYVGGRIQDVNHFLRFLRSLSLLRCLTLRDLCLGQEFYDQLPASARYLDTFTLHEPVIDKEEQQINFGFITQLSRLTLLEILSEISCESLASLLSYLGKLKESRIHFSFNGNLATITFLKRANGSKRYEVFWDTKKVLETENPGQVLNFFQKG